MKASESIKTAAETQAKQVFKEYDPMGQIQYHAMLGL